MAKTTNTISATAWNQRSAAGADTVTYFYCVVTGNQRTHYYNDSISWTCSRCKHTYHVCAQHDGDLQTWRADHLKECCGKIDCPHMGGMIDYTRLSESCAHRLGLAKKLMTNPPTVEAVLWTAHPESERRADALLQALYEQDDLPCGPNGEFTQDLYDSVAEIVLSNPGVLVDGSLAVLQDCIESGDR